ncbi:hypothetical protein BU16DRAFT_190576 [Lophium mytilinum]|uniref:Uncharacterized protein n=1 Tax=Lophium mytilinum TaxID=390894 RepID=A0A6A6R8H3_9PEZI|nr:hypothetical protein BU16DRAFT_190576 [Lophium mytilinum]
MDDKSPTRKRIARRNGQLNAGGSGTGTSNDEKSKNMDGQSDSGDDTFERAVKTPLDPKPPRTAGRNHVVSERTRASRIEAQRPQSQPLRTVSPVSTRPFGSAAGTSRPFYPSGYTTPIPVPHNEFHVPSYMKPTEAHKRKAKPRVPKPSTLPPIITSNNVEGHPSQRTREDTQNPVTQLQKTLAQGGKDPKNVPPVRPNTSPGKLNITNGKEVVKDEEQTEPQTSLWGHTRNSDSFPVWSNGHSPRSSYHAPEDFVKPLRPALWAHPEASASKQPIHQDGKLESPRVYVYPSSQSDVQQRPSSVGIDKHDPPPPSFERPGPLNVNGFEQQGRISTLTPPRPTKENGIGPLPGSNTSTNIEESEELQSEEEDDELMNRVKRIKARHQEMQRIFDQLGNHPPVEDHREIPSIEENSVGEASPSIQAESPRKTPSLERNSVSQATPSSSSSSSFVTNPEDSPNVPRSMKEKEIQDEIYVDQGATYSVTKTFAASPGRSHSEEDDPGTHPARQSRPQSTDTVLYMPPSPQQPQPFTTNNESTDHYVAPIDLLAPALTGQSRHRRGGRPPQHINRRALRPLTISIPRAPSEPSSPPIWDIIDPSPLLSPSSSSPSSPRSSDRRYPSFGSGLWWLEPPIAISPTIYALRGLHRHRHPSLPSTPTTSSSTFPSLSEGPSPEASPSPPKSTSELESSLDSSAIPPPLHIHSHHEPSRVGLTGACTHCSQHCPRPEDPPEYLVPNAHTHMKIFILNLAFIRALAIMESDPIKVLSLMIYKALPIAQGIEDPIAEARCWYWIGKAEATRGEWGESLRALKKAMELGLAGKERYTEGREIQNLLDIVTRWYKAANAAADGEEEADDPLLGFSGAAKTEILRSEGVPGLLPPVGAIGYLRTNIENSRAKKEDIKRKTHEMDETRRNEVKDYLMGLEDSHVNGSYSPTPSQSSASGSSTVAPISSPELVQVSPDQPTYGGAVAIIDWNKSRQSSIGSDATTIANGQASGQSSNESAVTGTTLVNSGSSVGESKKANNNVQNSLPSLMKASIEPEISRARPRYTRVRKWRSSSSSGSSEGRERRKLEHEHGRKEPPSIEWEHASLHPGSGKSGLVSVPNGQHEPNWETVTEAQKEDTISEEGEGSDTGSINSSKTVTASEKTSPTTARINKLFMGSDTESIAGSGASPSDETSQQVEPTTGLVPSFSEPGRIASWQKGVYRKPKPLDISISQSTESPLADYPIVGRTQTPNTLFPPFDHSYSPPRTANGTPHTPQALTPSQTMPPGWTGSVPQGQAILLGQVGSQLLVASRVHPQNGWLSRPPRRPLRPNSSSQPPNSAPLPESDSHSTMLQGQEDLTRRQTLPSSLESQDVTPSEVPTSPSSVSTTFNISDLDDLSPPLRRTSYQLQREGEERQQLRELLSSPPASDISTNASGSEAGSLSDTDESDQNIQELIYPGAGAGRARRTSLAPIVTTPRPKGRHAIVSLESSPNSPIMGIVDLEPELHWEPPDETRASPLAHLNRSGDRDRDRNRNRSRPGPEPIRLTYRQLDRIATIYYEQNERMVMEDLNHLVRSGRDLAKYQYDENKVRDRGYLTDWDWNELQLAGPEELYLMVKAYGDIRHGLETRLRQLEDASP